MGIEVIFTYHLLLLFVHSFTYSFTGIDCSEIECPSGPDVMKGYGNEAGRDCSGRGLCNYGLGKCECFSGFAGLRCQYQISYSS